MQERFYVQLGKNRGKLAASVDRGHRARFPVSILRPARSPCLLFCLPLKVPTPPPLERRPVPTNTASNPPPHARQHDQNKPSKHGTPYDYPDDHRPGDFDSKRVEWSDVDGPSPAGLTEANDDYLEEAPRKRVRIRVPVLRKVGRQHTRTVVRRRPVSSRTQDPPFATASPTLRRIVVTRVRTLGLANSIHTDEPESFRPEPGRHKVTITRRRKIEPTSVLPTTTDTRARITKKKLIAVRPVQPTPSFAIITAGFFTAPPSEYEEEYSEEAEDQTEEPKLEVTTTFTPELEEPPNVIDNTPDPTETSAPTEETATRVSEESSMDDPVIITDNFFFPAGEDEYAEYEEEYQETTTTENGKEPSDEDVPTTVKSPKDDENVVPSKDGVTTTPETPLQEKVTTAEPEEASEETATEMVSKDDAKPEDVSTTAKPTEDSTTALEEEIVTTQPDNLDTTVQEDDSTTVHPDINEEEEEEEKEKEEEIEQEEDAKEQMTTEKVMETTEPVNETMVISVPEDQSEATTHTEKDIDTTTETSVPETTVSSTESIESQIQPEVVDHLSKDAEGLLEKDTESHVTPTQPTVSESLPEKEIESHDTSTEPTVQSEPEVPPSDEEENDVQKPSVATKEENDVQRPSVTTEPPSEQEEPTVKMIQRVTEPAPSSPVVSTDTSSSIEIAASFASVLPLETYQSPSSDSPTPRYLDDSEIPSVIPLGADYTPSDAKRTSGVLEATPSLDVAEVTTSISSPTPEDIEAGLADDLYLSLSRPDFLQILPSKPTTVVDHQTKPPPDLEPSTSVFYTETVVTSTRLRTYTYVVTQQNGLETKVTSSTTVRPRVTTLTLTVPVTVTVTPTVESSANAVSSVYSPVPATGEHEVKDEEGRRLNLATRVMWNGVEVIVAGPTPALRWENSMPQPTLTLSDAVVMMLPQDKPNEFVTKTCTTTFTYFATITKDGTTTVSTEQQVVANTATEERHRKPGSETAAVTLDASPTLRTEIFKTTYTYLTLNTDHPNVDDALESSSKVITNTVTAPQHYLDMILEPSEAPRPETNTYLSTRMLEKTFMEDGRTRIETASDTVTQLIITESAPPPRPTSVTTTLTALDHTEESMTDVMKTYYITYTYYNTFLEKGSTVVRTNVATSTDVVLEKAPAKKTTKTALVNPTPEPIQIFATKTYLTTFTYFTTLLQAGADGETSTTVSSRSHIVENVVTESIAPSLLDAGYMNALLTTAHHSDSVKNVVTGSTIIFFDEEDQIDPTTTNIPESTATVNIQKDQTISASLVATEASPVVGEQNVKPVGQVNQTISLSGENGQNKRPANQNTSDLQVSNLLSLGSLGINALGPVITAMAGLLQGKSTITRRNDTVPQAEAQEVTTQRSPIYIPVAEFADGDIETAESQNIGTHLANLNYIAETRHKVASNLADGIPISPGEVITANSDVIIGKPGKMAPRPPQTFLEDEEHIGMKPPPLPVPNIPVHPVLEVLENDREDSQPQQTIQTHKGPQIQIYPAQQVYEEHLKIPLPIPVETKPVLIPKQAQKLHPVQSSPPKRMGSKQDVLENDPLLKPPERPNVEEYVNPNSNLKEPEWSPEKSRRPWSAKDPVVFSPPHPQFDQKMDSVKPLLEKPWPTVPTQEHRRPLWAPEDPLTPGPSVVIHSSESKPTPSEPILHQVPHVIDRSTGQDLLVNIQPSQVANVVIPQGGTQALIFGDTSEPHISGQYFDDPSPYPDSDIGLGFVGMQRVKDQQKYPNGKDPAGYMVPPSPPLNFRTQEKPGPPNRSATIPLSPDRFNYERPQDKLESPVLRPATQGHVHGEILMHHRPETVNLRPQGTLYSPSHAHVPPRGQFPKVQKPGESGNPPRRIEVPTPSDNSHRYILLPKPDSGNEILMNSNWKDKKPTRFMVTNSLRPRPPLWSTTNRPLDRPAYVERPIIRKHNYNVPQRPPPKIQNPGTFVLPHRPITNLQIHHDPPRISSTRPNDDGNEATTDRQPSFRPPQIELQDRPPHFNPDSKRPPTSTPLKPPAEYPDEHLPTGAIEYHNPSNPKVKSENPKPSVNGQNIDQTASNSKKQPESWQTDSQTEKTLDSEIGASEYVKYHKQITVVQDTQKIKGEEAANSQGNNVTLNENVASGNIVIGKPAGLDQAQEQKDKPIWLIPGVPFGHKIEVIPSQGMTYGPTYYDRRPNDMAIVQGKPFDVYNRHEDPSQYGHKRKEPRPDYDVVQGAHGNRNRKPSDKHHSEVQTSTNRPHERDDTIDLRPPAIIPHFGPEVHKPSRYPRPPTINKIETRPALYPRPESVTHPPKKTTDQQHADAKPEPSESFANNSLSHEFKANKSQTQFGGSVNLNWQGATKVPDQRHDESRPVVQESHSNKSDTVRPNFRNSTSQKPDIHLQSNIETTKPLFEKTRPKVTHPEYSPGTRIHPEYPHIVTKPRPQVPGPITITTGNSKPDSRPNIKFSLPVEAIGQEVDSKTQTERPPSMLITVNNLNDKKKNDESLVTAYQTNFAVAGVDKGDSKKHDTRIRPVEQSTGDVLGIEGVNVPSRDMMPPPLRPPVLNQSNKNEEEGLKPPPIPSHDVVGLSPPPVDITTTGGPMEDRFSFATANDSGLKPPPKYIPLKEATVAPLPSVSMVPPSPRPSVARPFIVELLSQDMVPPPPATQTTRPLEIATVRPAVAVSGSIQIATAVATSHIPVIHDLESKIPIIHGTVDLPVVVDVPDILRPVETMITEHVSIYTVRPFDTRPVSRISIQPTPMLTTNKMVPTKLRPLQVDHIQPSRSSSTYREIEPTKSYTFDPHVPRNPVKRPEHPVFLESSHENVLPSSRVEPTESLTSATTTSQKKDHRTTMHKDTSTKVAVPQATEAKRRNETTIHELPSMVTRVDSSITKVTNVLPDQHQGKNESVIKMTKDIAASTVRKPVNGSTTTMQMKPKEVTRFQTSTVTRVETSVLGSPPTTRTLLITHTLTSTTVETVTETLLRPTSVISTITSTILQSIVTRIPSSFENVVDNDSIFVVLSDQKPPAPGAEEVEAEYDDISRGEQDSTGNEIHRVLAGGVLGAPVVSLQPVSNQCAPECRASKAEICAEVEGEMRCVCRPGFARMFPDRPCKPTYTYTLRVGLDRIGHKPVNYDSSMNDTTSPAYRRLLGPTKDALDRTLMQSDLRDIYRGLKIAGFTPDPTKVEFHVQLSDNANETRLKEVLQKYLIGSNYSLGGTEVYASKSLEMIDAIDFDECMTEEGGPHHDCSPNAACFNLRGSYQCSCKEGWADLSENPTYPGRVCSQAPLGCPSCNNKGHCVTNTNGQEVCECFPWHSGQRCQVNLKVLLIALVTTGAILLGLLAVCVGMACFRHPSRKRQAGDRRAMIPGTGGDTSSEGSVTDLAIPHHVPHVLPPPPQMIAPLPPSKRPVRKISGKPRQPARKATMVAASVPVNDEQRDRSLTVMIPRAKYRSAPQSPQNYKSGMSTFSTEEHKLLSYLDNGTHNTGNRKQSVTSMKDCKEADVQVMRTPATPTGALVSAGFQVSATVTRTMDADSTLARSCGETTVETATKVLRTTDPGDLGSTLPRSCGETTIQAPTKLLRLDLGEAGSTLARSCGETTIQPPTKVADARRSSIKDNRDNRDTRDSASEGHTMAERDLGSTLRLPAQHPPLYSPDRASDRESNFDSL
ncbi:uncharacterized protein LOC143353869 [Halictus rubicundus]|uniref:uncharacterized protein LOC143353869 n=1 Tax=Halictus rubicundus TaxID=77578 RepID=UPI0040357160